MRVEFRIETCDNIRVHRVALRLFIHEMRLELLSEFREHLSHFLEFLRKLIPNIRTFLLGKRRQLRASLRTLAALIHCLTLQFTELFLNAVLHPIHVFHNIPCNTTRQVLQVTTSK